MPTPYSVQLAIDRFRKEKPNYSNLSDEDVYRHLKRKQKHLQWEDADKVLVKSKKRKDKVSYYETPEGQSEYVAQRQGEYDGPYEDDFASGGIAGMLGE